MALEGLARVFPGFLSFECEINPVSVVKPDFGPYFISCYFLFFLCGQMLHKLLPKCAGPSIHVVMALEGLARGERVLEKVPRSLKKFIVLEKV